MSIEGLSDDVDVLGVGDKRGANVAYHVALRVAVSARTRDAVTRCEANPMQTSPFASPPEKDFQTPNASPPRDGNCWVSQGAPVPPVEGPSRKWQPQQAPSGIKTLLFLHFYGDCLPPTYSMHRRAVWHDKMCRMMGFCRSS